MSAPDEEAWRQIVEHYGDRPDFPDDPDSPGSPGSPDRAAAGAHVGGAAADGPPEADRAGTEERFVPPDPEPVPRPRGKRLVAWLGVVGAPLLLVLVAISGFPMDTTVSTFLVVWFLGGFLFLVWQMPRDRGDPWDDGARV